MSKLGPLGALGPLGSQQQSQIPKFQPIQLPKQQYVQQNQSSQEQYQQLQYNQPQYQSASLNNQQNDDKKYEKIIGVISFDQKYA